ncbi:MAG: flagellar biosynthesis protein FliQ [Armatimonadota bacterium]
MTDATILDIMHRAIVLSMSIITPILGSALAVGMAVSVFQAATQIHETSLTFIPKVLAVAGAVAAFGPWMLNQLVKFTTKLLESIPGLVG